jgi:hypothetical protein
MSSKIDKAWNHGELTYDDSFSQISLGNFDIIDLALTQDFSSCTLNAHLFKKANSYHLILLLFIYRFFIELSLPNHVK